MPLVVYFFLKNNYLHSFWKNVIFKIKELSDGVYIFLGFLKKKEIFFTFEQTNSIRWFSLFLNMEVSTFSKSQPQKMEITPLSSIVILRSHY